MNTTRATNMTQADDAMDHADQVYLMDGTFVAIKPGAAVTKHRFGLSGRLDHVSLSTVVKVTKKFAVLESGEKVRLNDGIVLPKYLDYTTRVISVE